VESPAKNADLKRVDLRSLEIKIARSENLPVLPQIVSQVLKLADDPDASPKEMERIIQSDPAVTAKILRVANSSYYGVNQIPSIGRAISMLGMNTIRSLVIGVAYQQIISGRAIASHFNKLEFWRHSLGVATAARILSKMKMPMKSEEMYVAGMMHDVGLLVMDRFHPLELDKAIQFAVSEEMPLHQSEQLNFGFDHCQIGAMLAESWGLSTIVLHAVRYHHEPEMDDVHRDTTMIIALANHLAHQCGLTNNIPNQPCEIEDSLLETIGIPREQLDIIKNVVVQEIARAEEAFQIT
jgi:HD-like signal output (HDOD) protein